MLLRVEKPSVLGAWSYEVVDNTKLARETKAGTVLQLCLYADLVENAQNLRPEQGYVVAPHTGYEPQPYRMADYGAYFRRVRASLLNSVANGGGDQTYPDPCAHCDICRWAFHLDQIINSAISLEEAHDFYQHCIEAAIPAFRPVWGRIITLGRSVFVLARKS